MTTALNFADLREEDKKRARRRTFTPDELKTLSEQSPPSPLTFLAQVAFPALSSGALLGAIGFLSVELLGWITELWSMRKSDYTIQFALVFGVAGIAIVLFEMLKKEPSKASRRLWRNEIDAGTADEVILDVADAKGCRDPEHGVLAYFVRLADGRIFLDSFRNKMPEDDDWKNNPARVTVQDLPKRELKFLYGSVSGNLLLTGFSGETFKPSGVFMLKDNPESWPELGEFCRVSWEKIEDRYAQR